MSRVFNFSAGPAALPTSVLEQARTEMGSLLFSQEHLAQFVSPDSGVFRGSADLPGAQFAYPSTGLKAGAENRFFARRRKALSNHEFGP